MAGRDKADESGLSGDEEGDRSWELSDSSEPWLGAKNKTMLADPKTGSVLLGDPFLLLGQLPP